MVNLAAFSQFIVRATRTVLAGQRLYWTWVCALLAIIVTIQRRRDELYGTLLQRRLMLTLAGSTIAVALNWLTFIYAGSVNRVLEASLGYFLTPRFTVVLAIVFLKERLR